MRYIKELRDGDNIIEFYLCKQKQQLQGKTGKSYLSLTLLDKTGTANGKVWDLNNKIQSFEEGDFIKIAAVVQTYNNELQLNIKQIRKANEGEYDDADYIPATDKDINSMYQKLLDYIASIENAYIKELLTNVFVNNEKIAERFKKHSAAKSMHHNYLGGLIEHTLSVTEICDFYSKHYENVNRDLLVSCALLHDVCKIKELTDFPRVDYTDAGELIGHIVMGSELIEREASRIKDFPRDIKVMMKHCILAHHGEYEYGSPKLPKLLEAFLLHCADDTDAKAKMFTDSLNNSDSSVKWTEYNRVLSTKIRRSNF